MDETNVMTTKVATSSELNAAKKEEFILGEKFSLPYILRTNELELKKEFESYKMKRLLSLKSSAMLAPDISIDEMKGRISDAVTNGFYAVSVQPSNIERTRRLLKKDKLKTDTVVSFPFGEDTMKAKIYAVKEALRFGADGIDCVLSTSAIKRGDYRYLKREAKKIARVGRGKVRLTLEATMLSRAELERAINIITVYDADIRLGTGYYGGTDKESIGIAKKYTAARKKKLFVSGGIRTFEDVLTALSAGADMIVSACAGEITQGFLKYFK